MPLPQPQSRLHAFVSGQHKLQRQHNLSLLVRTTLALFPHQLRFLTGAADLADRLPHRSRRLNFTSSPARNYPSLSPLFALSQLSNARESQALAKTSRLSRVEHSPALQLIRSSEVEQLPFVTTSNSPVQAKRLQEERLSEWQRFKVGRGRRSVRNAGVEREWQMFQAGQGEQENSNSVTRSLKRDPSQNNQSFPNSQHRRDSDVATAVGRAVLEKQHQREQRLQRQLAVALRQHTREAAHWADERQKLDRERKSGAAIVLLAACVGTGALAWRLSDSGLPQAANSAPLERWQRKWETRETERQRLAAQDYAATSWTCHEPGCNEAQFDSQSSFHNHYWDVHPDFMSNFSKRVDDYDATSWTCHELGCNEAAFASQLAFDDHYWQAHPQLMTHLPVVRRQGVGGKGWFWS